MGDEFRWIFPGWSWSGTQEPKQVVVDDPLRGAIGSRLDGPFRQEPDFVLAGGDRVVVQTRGYGMTRNGCACNNTYCLIFRLRHGRLTEVIEHCDTADRGRTTLAIRPAATTTRSCRSGRRRPRASSG